MGKRILEPPFKRKIALRNRAKWGARARHVAVKVASLTIGAAFVGWPFNALRQWRSRRQSRPVCPWRVAVLAHVYYPELIGEILVCLETMPDGTDLIVTTIEERQVEIMTRLAGIERVRVFVMPNRGRDIAPFLALLNDGTLDPYDVILKLHTKRSPQLLDGNIRRKLLYAILAGSRASTSRVLALFENVRTGLVGWRLTWRDGPFYWMRNRPWLLDLTQRLGMKLPDDPAFFEGSMFWVRPRALRPLRALNLGVENFEPESGQTDGTLHHAVERIFAWTSVSAGYTVRDLRGNHLLDLPHSVDLPNS